MRRFLFIALLSMALLYAYGQRPTVSNYWKSYSVEAEVGNPVDGSEVLEGSVVPFKSTNLVEESEIGETWYDKQSNRAVANRVYRYPDGTMAGVWTFGLNATGFDDRGAGYNYYDGNQWGLWPTSRIESVKCGWPSYAPLGENGEIIVSHNASDALYINRRIEKGTGAWTESIIQGPPGYEKITWPRVITDGEDNNIVHVLGQIREYPAAGDMTLGYYRSMDGGETWDLLNYEIPGTGPDYYTEVGADSYTFAEPRNGVIAFFVANLWCDAFIMKSTDNGDTWEKTIVWEHPYPFYDDNTVFTDTCWAPDNSGHIALDSEGKAHVVFGLGFIIKTEVGTTYTHYPGYQDGIVYWNEDMPAFEYQDQHDALDPYDVLEENVNLIGWSQDLDGNGELDFTDDIISYSEIGLSTMPNITIDDQNRIFVAWASTTEGYDNGVNNYKHIWARTAIDPEMGWSEFHDLTGDLVHIFDECIYPQFAPLTDDNLYMMYNLDLSPGNAVDGDHDYQQNKQVMMTISKDEILSVGEGTALSQSMVSQNYPNPCSEATVIQVELQDRALMAVHIYDLMGREVASQPEQVFSAGTHRVTLSVADLQAGVYFYTVAAGDARVTRKMIVE
jgi:hypothetical protein